MSEYVLPEPDSDLLAAALKAYRLAVQYSRRMCLKWEPRREELRRLDEFHRTRCAWENDDYRGERIVAAAQRALLTVAGGSKKLSSIDSFDQNMFDKCKDRDFVRAVRALEAVYKLARGAG